MISSLSSWISRVSAALAARERLTGEGLSSVKMAPPWRIGNEFATEPGAKVGSRTFKSAAGVIGSPAGPGDCGPLPGSSDSFTPTEARIEALRARLRLSRPSMARSPIANKIATARAATAPPVPGEAAATESCRGGGGAPGGSGGPGGQPPHLWSTRDAQVSQVSTPLLVILTPWSESNTGMRSPARAACTPSHTSLSTHPLAHRRIGGAPTSSSKAARRPDAEHWPLATDRRSSRLPWLSSRLATSRSARSKYVLCVQPVHVPCRAHSWAATPGRKA